MPLCDKGKELEYDSFTVRNKLKILISCYACSPYHGSEPGMGWQFIEHLAQSHELHVIVEKEKWQNDIEEELIKKPELNNNLKFFFISKTRNRVLRKIWPPSYYWFYSKWQKKAYDLAVNLCRKENYDVVHQLNMVGFREPGYLWKINLPYVWGPIGGMENTPWRMLPIMGLYGMTYYTLRNLINKSHINFLDRPRKAANKSNNILIAATPHNAAIIKKKWKKDAIVITEVGLLNTSNSISNIIHRDVDTPLRVIWSGQHTPGKALNLLLLAMSKLDSTKFRLDVLGDGKQTAKWQDLSKRALVNHSVHWHGWMKREKALEIMKSGHVFVITSLKDLTASVTLEALSLGLPVICLDHCGFSYVVNESCGIKIPVQNPKRVIKDIAEALDYLFMHENVRLKLAEGALIRAKEFSWEKKVEQIEGVYYKLIRESNK